MSGIMVFLLGIWTGIILGALGAGFLAGAHENDEEGN